MSPDWSVQEEPVPYAKLDDPQTLNLYGYLKNNPLVGVDADGHDGPDCGCPTLQLPQLPTKQDLKVAAIVVTTVVSMALHDLNPLNAFHKDAPAPEQTQHGATNEAKKDAGVPTSQQPSSQQTVPVTDSNGKQVVVDGKPQTSREQTHTTATGATVVMAHEINNPLAAKCLRLLNHIARRSNAAFTSSWNEDEGECTSAQLNCHQTRRRHHFRGRAS